MKQSTAKWIFFGGVMVAAGVGLVFYAKRRRELSQQPQQATPQQVATMVAGQSQLDFAPSGGDFRVVMEEDY